MKFYIKVNRETGNPVYIKVSELVGIYMEVVSN